MSHATGLAGAIRGSTESDTFDLGGQNVSTITTNVTNAFEEPLQTDEMIRITLVTGAGKLGRQKYDENAAKAVTAALRQLGFEDDRGASCVKECAGSFKLQHDTGKNLKTVVVFPRIRESSAGAEEGEASSTSGGNGGDSILVKGSPQEMIALSSKTVFENMVKSRCASWSQKKGCVAGITEIQTTLTEFEQKLLTGTPLADAEQTFYDAVSSTVLQEKQTYVKELMHQQVDEGIITSQEKTQLLSQVSERVEMIAKDLAEAETKQQAKKVEKLETMKEKAQARKDKLSKISAKAPHRLKHEADIFKLNKELKPLLDLEESSKGRLLTIKETQNMARKEEILEEIAEFEEKSRGWFEEDEAFEKRLDACASAYSTQSKQKNKTVKKAAPSSSTINSAWMTSTGTKPKGKSKMAGAASKKKSANKGGGVFAAMMIDSDSD